MRNSPFRDLYVQRTDIVPRLTELVLTSTNSAFSKTMAARLKSDLLSFVTSSVSPKDYDDAESFKLDYLCAEMFSKYPYWDLGINRPEVALAKFLESETHCRETNVRLASTRNFSYWTTSVFATASRKIAALLGPLDWSEASRYFDFGPGATTRVRKHHADRYYKLSGIPECTADCLALADAALRWNPLWGNSVSNELSVVRANKIVTVPKNAKTDRVIAIEPCMNIYVQKGLGGVIRNRLRQVGVDLNDQRKNQRLAREGSLDNSLVTIDLSSASDTVSIEIVRQLLPPDWVIALEMTRSPAGKLPSGEIITYQKFSSMGNGFTFELESLIFWALCSAVRSLSSERDRRMAVYGDDIIVPQGISSAVCDVLEFAGFSVNKKKTHVDGPFRESCGKHYFRGTDVTPIYVKDRVDTYPRFIWLYNQLKRWSWTGVWGCYCFQKPAADFVRSQLHGYWSKPRICDGMGDGALIGDFDEVCPPRAAKQFEGWTTTCFSEIRETFLPDDSPILLKSLYALEKRAGPPESSVSFLGVPLNKRKYRVGKTLVWQWHDLGPWLV